MTVTRCHSAAGTRLLSRPPRPLPKPTDTRRAGEAPVWAAPLGAGGARKRTPALALAPQGPACAVRAACTFPRRSEQGPLGQRSSSAGPSWTLRGAERHPCPRPRVTTTDVPRRRPVPPGGRTAGARPRGFRAGCPRRCAGPGRVLAVHVRVDGHLVPTGLRGGSPSKPPSLLVRLRGSSPRRPLCTRGAREWSGPGWRQPSVHPAVRSG